MSALNPVERLVERRCNPRPLGLYRIATGLVALLSALVTQRDLAQLYNPLTVRLPYFFWFPELGPRYSDVFIGVWIAAAAMFTLGLFTRWAGAFLVACITYRFLIDVSLYWTQIYLCGLMILLLTIGDSGAGLSLDRLRRGPPEPRIARWPQTLIQLQVSIVYLFAGLGKINTYVLSGEYFMSRVSPLDAIGSPLLAQLITVATVAFELAIPFTLWSRKLQYWFFFAGFMFHLGILGSIGVYAAFIGYAVSGVAGYPLFVDWDARRGTLRAPEDLLRRVGRLDWFGLYRGEPCPGSLEVETAAGVKRGAEAIRELLHGLPATMLIAAPASLLVRSTGGRP